jgi:hypothetical protein
MGRRGKAGTTDFSGGAGSRHVLAFKMAADRERVSKKGKPQFETVPLDILFSCVGRRCTRFGKKTGPFLFETGPPSSNGRRESTRGRATGGDGRAQERSTQNNQMAPSTGTVDTKAWPRQNMASFA